MKTYIGGGEGNVGIRADANAVFCLCVCLNHFYCKTRSVGEEGKVAVTMGERWGGWFSQATEEGSVQRVPLGDG